MKFVKSLYASPWVGVVLEEYDIRTSFPKKYKGLGYKVLIVYNKQGKVPKKRIIHSRNKDWFQEIKPFDIDFINKDWFKT